MQVLSSLTKDYKEALAAFVEKRTLPDNDPVMSRRRKDVLLEPAWRVAGRIGVVIEGAAREESDGV